MADSAPDISELARVASDSAQIFVDHFYETLNKRASPLVRRSNLPGVTTTTAEPPPLTPYYASSSPRLAAASVTPDISINGQVCSSVAEFESLLAAQGRPVSYEVQSWDAHPLTPGYKPGAPERGASKVGDRLSFAVQVSGQVGYGVGKETVRRGFTEAFVLVPNWEFYGRNPARGIRRYLIVSQNFRGF